MLPDYDIREMTQSDIDSIFPLDNAIFSQDEKLSKQQLCLYYSPNYSFVAVDKEKDEIIGYLFVQKNNNKFSQPDFFIGSFAIVNKQHRGQGIGTKLMDAVKNNFKKESSPCLSIGLQVRNSNKLAVNIYQKRGFVVVKDNGIHSQMVKLMDNGPSLSESALTKRNKQAKLLKQLLNDYIKRIQSYKGNLGYGFWFFRESRAINRAANYQLARSLIKQLDKPKPIAEVFFPTNLNKHRNEFFTSEKKAQYNRNINSNELKSIIQLANQQSLHEQLRVPI